MEYDEREGKVLAYLDTLLPEDWYSLSVDQRVDYFQSEADTIGLKHEPGTLRRTKVCCLELWVECFGKSERTMTRQDAHDMASLMARMPGWERTGARDRIPGYSQQRPFIRV